MKISLDWISDYVDLGDIPADRVADRLTMCTAEVEDVIEIRRSVNRVIVGEVISCRDIPGVSGLKVAVVDCGTQRFQTVCGAPNVRQGLKAPFAPPGTRLRMVSKSQWLKWPVSEAKASSVLLLNWG